MEDKLGWTARTRKIIAHTGFLSEERRIQAIEPLMVDTRNINATNRKGREGGGEWGGAEGDSDGVAQS